MQAEKIQATHRARITYVYVRQSSPYQVEHNPESQRLQYQWAENARHWGFADVRVIDEDLGLSATESDKRTGFQKLVAEVTLRWVAAHHPQKAGWSLVSVTACRTRTSASCFWGEPELLRAVSGEA